MFSNISLYTALASSMQHMGKGCVLTETHITSHLLTWVYRKKKIKPGRKFEKSVRKSEVLFLMRILGFFATNRVFLHKIQLQNHNIALQRAIKIKFLLKNHRKKIVFDENFQN